MFYLREENFPGYPTEDVRRSVLGTRNSFPECFGNQKWLALYD